MNSVGMHSVGALASESKYCVCTAANGIQLYEVYCCISRTLVKLLSITKPAASFAVVCARSMATAPPSEWP